MAGAGSRTSRSLSPRGRQQKGRQFELWVLKKLWASCGLAWPWKHQRPDDGHSVPKPFEEYHVECKRQERLNWWDAIEQAREEAGQSAKNLWAVVVRRNRDRPVVVIDLEDWIELNTTVHDLSKR